LIIEDVRRNRFFEISYDEYPRDDELEESDRLFQKRIVSLTDISICISRMTVEAMVFRMRRFKPGASIEQAVDVGALHRHEIWTQFFADLQTDPSEGSSDRSTYEKLELGPPELGGLRATVELSFDETIKTREDLFEQTASELSELLGRLRAYWQDLPKQHRFECQVLRFAK
jgi:hypothetical protein